MNRPDPNDPIFLINPPIGSPIDKMVCEIDVALALAMRRTRGQPRARIRSMRYRSDIAVSSYIRNPDNSHGERALAILKTIVGRLNQIGAKP
jgi:hypothetical protein